MSLLEKILIDIKKIKNPLVLNRLFEFMNFLTESESESNKESVFQFAGKISDKDAKSISNDIENEFSSIEGDW